MDTKNTRGGQSQRIKTKLRCTHYIEQVIQNNFFINKIKTSEAFIS